MHQQTSPLKLVDIPSENSIEDPKPITKKPCKEQTNYYYCGSCGKVHSKTHTCNERYAECCYPERQKRNYARLMGMEIKARRLIHIVIGFKKKKDLPNKDNKKVMEKQLSKLHRKVRKVLDIKFRGIRIFDLADDGCYEHYHYAILPERIMMNRRSLNIDVKLFRSLLKKVTKGKSEVIKVFGFRSKSNLFHYFSKRTAGKYGHGKESFFLSDIMSYEEYRVNFFNVRSLVNIGFPEGICSINAQTPHKCPYCNSLDVHLVDIIPSNMEFIMPDWLLDVQEHDMKGKLWGFS